jgi:hypothetical protein
LTTAAPAPATTLSAVVAGRSGSGGQGLREALRIVAIGNVEPPLSAQIHTGGRRRSKFLAGTARNQNSDHQEDSAHRNPKTP